MIIVILLKSFDNIGSKQVLAIYCHCMEKCWSKNMQFMIAAVEFC